jgi:hypothetical protein
MPRIVQYSAAMKPLPVLGTSMLCLHDDFKCFIQILHTHVKKQLFSLFLLFVCDQYFNYWLLDFQCITIDEFSRQSTYSRDVPEDEDTDCVDLGSKVRGQLRDLVQNVAGMYRDLPFHCFEHASHTLLSVTKLLAGVEATAATKRQAHGPPDSLSGTASIPLDAQVHKMTCDMILHPMTQFTVVFAALVHDMD